MSTAFLRNLRARPTVTVALFRSLLVGPVVEGSDRYSVLEWANGFRDAIRSDDPIEELIGEHNWLHIALALLDIYVDAVSAPNFFSRPLVRISIPCRRDIP